MLPGRVAGGSSAILSRFRPSRSDDRYQSAAELFDHCHCGCDISTRCYASCRSRHRSLEHLHRSRRRTFLPFAECDSDPRFFCTARDCYEERGRSRAGPSPPRTGSPGKISFACRSRVPACAGPTVGWPLQYRVSGPDPGKVRELAHEVAQMAASNPYIKNVNFDWMEPVKTLDNKVDHYQARIL